LPEASKRDDVWQKSRRRLTPMRHMRVSKQCERVSKAA